MQLADNANLSDLFLQRVKLTADSAAYRQFVDNAWCDWTWGDMAREVGRWQTALTREGLKPGDRVGLCLHNRVEWVLFDQAAIGLGLVTVPMYFDDRPENMAWSLTDSGVRVLLVESARQWEAIKGQVETVERVVMVGEVSSPDPKVRRLKDWLPTEAAEPRRSPAGPDDLVTIVYTSGTTGRPKGVMLSHGNIMSNVIGSMHAIPVSQNDRFLSFLPLSHMFERTCGYYSAIWAGGQTVYARSISQLGEDLATQRPTVLIAVPRIFERIWGRMREQMPTGTPKRKLFDKAVEVGWRGFKGEMTFGDKVLWPLLKTLVAKKLQRLLGGRIRLIIAGGAAMPPDLSRIFISLGLPILQGYGLTETSPVLAANRTGDNDPTTVGRPLEGVELRADDSGELLARGSCVMLGYWNNPSATAAVIDKDGWFHTGDLVRIRDGRVTITGRVKEIIVLSNGEKVPPADAEQAILRDAAFDYAMVIGEGRPKLGLVCASKVTDLHDLCARANAQLSEFPGYARIAHIARVEGPWTVENGLLTPTLKMKRRYIETQFAKEIEAAYATTEFCSPTKA